MSTQDQVVLSPILSPQERRQRNRDEMKQAILNTARQIMRQDGAAALNLHELARRLGMRTSSLYVYFPGKMAIYDALFQISIGLYRKEIQQALQTLYDPQEVLSTVFTRYMEIAIKNPELYQITFERPVPGFTPSEASLVEMRLMQDEMTQLINRVIPVDRAGLNPGVPPSHGLVIALMHGMTALHIANNPDIPTGEGIFGSLIPLAVDLFRTAWDKNISVS